MAVTHMATRGSGYNANTGTYPAIRLGVVGYTGFRGTAALPAIYWEEDPNTGIYSNAADNLSFAAGGVEYMRIKATPTFGSITTTAASGDSIGFQSKIAQGATTTGEVYGAQISPRTNAGFGAASLIGMSVDPILKQTGNLAGNITNLRGLQVTFTDENLGSSTRTITNTAMIRLWHQLDSSHTITNGVVGINWEAAGARAWTFAMKFADDSGTGLADLASATATVNGVIKVQIGSTTGYIPTYATYTPA